MFIVTGGAGLIGSAIVHELNSNGVDDILIVDHLGESEKWKNLRALRFSDYCEKDPFRRMLAEGAFESAQIDGVIHMGACSSTTELDGSYLIDNNFNATKELAKFSIRKNIRFLYASSCATYGDGSMGYDDDLAAIHLLRPLNMYGYSKQLFDLWARKEKLFDRITGCKFSNVYGVNEQHKGNMRSVVCRAYEQLTASGKLQLFRSYRPEYADGEQMRDFLYVKDAAKMVLFLFQHPNGVGLFNIGSGKAETWNALARAAFKALDLPVNIEYIDMPLSLQEKYQYYTKAEMNRFYALGYPHTPMTLDEAVADYYRLRSAGKFLGD